LCCFPLIHDLHMEKYFSLKESILVSISYIYFSQFWLDIDINATS
jgi:hypothetical protein